MEPDSLVTVAVDGAKLVYRRIGRGQPLLILNGFGATGADWDPRFGRSDKTFAGGGLKPVHSPLLLFGMAHTAVSTLEHLSRRLARPCFPALTDRLCVSFHVHFFQPFDAIFERLGRFFIFFPGRFEEWPEKRE
jgi:pimeloyl-ACP methyl ester carboxylesterase